MGPAYRFSARPRDTAVERHTDQTKSSGDENRRGNTEQRTQHTAHVQRLARDLQRLRRVRTMVLVSTASPLSSVGDGALTRLLDELSEPRWRAQQIRRAAWQPYIDSFRDVRQLPHRLRDALSEKLAFSTIERIVETEADSGSTVKLLCHLSDGLTIETVAMESPATGRQHRRATVCVSSQVGCAVGCPFCATGRMGLRRSCSAAEIVDQVRAAGAALHRRGFGPLTHVVYMGMGEPLANADATIESLHILTRAAQISARRITVSTSGVVPGIDRLRREAPPVTLAVSLHAASDELRNRLVPLNRRYPLRMLLEGAQRYASTTHRRITFEWCLIGGVNDSLTQAEALRTLAWENRAHVNVIPMNRIAGSPWGPPDTATTQAFLRALRGVRTTMRDTRGEAADAACGQLRAALDERRTLRSDGSLSAPRPLVTN